MEVTGNKKGEKEKESAKAGFSVMTRKRSSQHVLCGSALVCSSIVDRTQLLTCGERGHLSCQKCSREDLSPWVSMLQKW